jgi:hypothetical protein
MSLRIGLSNKSMGIFHGSYAPWIQGKTERLAESILTGIKTNNDTFPETGDLFIEKLIE